MQEIEVDCPCCEARLVIDVRTRTVLRHALPDQLDEFGKPKRDGTRWDAAIDRVGGRRDGAEDAFDSALQKEHRRSKDLDALFDRAKDKIDKRRTELGEDESDEGS